MDDSGDGFNEGLSQGVGVSTLVWHKENVAWRSAFAENGTPPDIEGRAKGTENSKGSLFQRRSCQIDDGDQF